MKELYELKDMLCRELEEYGKKGEITAGTLDVVDKLAHSIKNLDKIIEAYDDGYSGNYPYRDGSYNDRGGYTRMRNYSRGRYGYSRNDLTAKLRELMQDAPDERTRQEMKRMIEKMENA